MELGLELGPELAWPEPVTPYQVQGVDPDYRLQRPSCRLVPRERDGAGGHSGVWYGRSPRSIPGCLCQNLLGKLEGQVSRGHSMSHTAPTPQSAPWWPRWPKPPSSIHRPLAQVREAYLQFMVSVATMLRKDMNLPNDNSLVEKEMAQVLALEAHLANVRQGHAGRRGLGAECHAV